MRMYMTKKYVCELHFGLELGKNEMNEKICPWKVQGEGVEYDLEVNHWKKPSRFRFPLVVEVFLVLLNHFSNPHIPAHDNMDLWSLITGQSWCLITGQSLYHLMKMI